MKKIKNATYMPGGYVYSYHYHLIWVTKYRQPVFDNPIKQQATLTLLKRIEDLNDIKIQSSEVMLDHIHLLVSFSPRMSITNVIKAFKGASTWLWFQQYPQTKQLLWKGHLRPRSYYAGTVDDMSAKTVKQYIANQRTTKAKSGRKPILDTDWINVLAGYHASTTILIIKQYFINRDTKY